MKIAISVVIITYGVICASAKYVKLDKDDKSESQVLIEKVLEGPRISRTEQTSEDIEITTNLISEGQKNQSSYANKFITSDLINRIITAVRQKPPASPPEPAKQLFGGRLPPFIERIIQRVQNYFSVYNPPEYFDNKPQPPQSTITIVCSNSDNEGLGCSQGSESEGEENVEACEAAVVESQEETSSAPQQEYNVVVTHTVVQDSQLNVYSPVDTAQTFSNVVVILEPTAVEYTPPVQTTPRNKFYVYVNPTSANKNKEFTESVEKLKDTKPYINSTYTIVIRGDRLEEYTSNLEDSVQPEIAVFLQNTTNIRRNNERPKITSEEILLASKSVVEESVKSNVDNKVPNINLVLVPPEETKSKRNKTCSKNKVTNAGSQNPSLEYYVLKPDSGNKNKENTYSLQKTQLDAISATYLPPRLLEDENLSTTEETTEFITVTPERDQSKFPLIFNLFKKKANEPRQL